MEQQQQEHYQQINQQKPNTFKNESFELIKTLIIFCMIYFVTKGYIAQPFLVKGRSMEQTLSDGDYLIVDQLTYNFTAPKRFEVVVFHTEFIPGGSGGEYYIKRVIGVPGDRVVIKEGKVILISNVKLVDPLRMRWYVSALIKYLSPSCNALGNSLSNCIFQPSPFITRISLSFLSLCQISSSSSTSISKFLIKCVSESLLSEYGFICYNYFHVF